MARVRSGPPTENTAQYLHLPAAVRGACPRRPLQHLCRTPAEDPLTHALPVGPAQGPSLGVPPAFSVALLRFIYILM